MGRAKGNLIENLATLPWPAGVVFGVGGFFAIRTSAAEKTHSGLVPRTPFPVLLQESWR